MSLKTNILNYITKLELNHAQAETLGNLASVPLHCRETIFWNFYTILESALQTLIAPATIIQWMQDALLSDVPEEWTAFCEAVHSTDPAYKGENMLEEFN